MMRLGRRIEPPPVCSLAREQESDCRVWQAEGESRRARIKGDFGEEDSRLAKMGRDVDALKDQYVPPPPPPSPPP